MNEQTLNYLIGSGIPEKFPTENQFWTDRYKNYSTEELEDAVLVTSERTLPLCLQLEKPAVLLASICGERNRILQELINRDEQKEFYQS